MEPFKLCDFSTTLRHVVFGMNLQPADAPAISLHKPHPGSIVKRYVIDDVLRLLTDEKLI